MFKLIFLGGHQSTFRQIARQNQFYLQQSESDEHGTKA